MRFALLVLLSAAAAAAAPIDVDLRNLESGNAQTVYRVGASFFNDRATLDLADGSYAVTSNDGALTYGVFTVSGGAVSGASGGIAASGTAAVTGVPSAFAPVKVPGSTLSSGNAQTAIRIGNHIVLWSGDGTFSLPPGTYAITDYAQVASYGAFTVAGTAVSAASGALAIAAGGISFDPAALASVHVPASTLSTGNSQTSVRVSTSGGGLTVIWSGDSTLLLPPGSYSITDYAFVASYGGFTVAGTSVVGASGAVATAPGGISFSLGKLAAVSPGLSALSAPAGLQQVRLSTAGGGLVILWTGDGTAYLPDGAYTVTDYDATVVYGGFTVAGGTLTAASGALTLAGGALGYNPCAAGLFHARVSLPAGSWTALAPISTYFAGAATFTVTPGSYSLTDGEGSFNVSAAGSVTTISAAPGVSFSAQACAQPPVAVAKVPAGGLVGVAVLVDGSGSTDPAGSIASYAWSFGDGAFASGATASHAYAAAGAYRVTLLVTSADGQSASTAAYVNIQSASQAIASLAGMPGVTRGLTAKLAAAQDSLARGNRTAAINELHAFDNQVAALAGKSLTPAQAATLVAAADAIVQSILAGG